MDGCFAGCRMGVSAALVVLALVSACDGADTDQGAVAIPSSAPTGGTGGTNASGGAGDTLAPRVMGTDPPAGAVGVARDSTVRATFSEAIDPRTLDSRSFVLTDENGAFLPGALSFSGKVATFAPVSEFAPASTVTARLSAVIADLAGNALPADVVWSFRTVVDAWQATTLERETPVERTGHTAVWTGTEMVVWGGMTAIGLTASGGRLVPTSADWIETTTAGAPLPRSAHTAVWTGSQMIVWGGATSTAATRMGARYMPGAAGGDWSATAVADAPAPRRDHTAVWTGSEMIVWGGQDHLQLLRSGGRYDPVTDTWSSMSTVGAPSARLGHTAIWTGSEMIVWGGSDALQSALSTGARYDPATDTWSTMSTVNAPLARADHTVVWTGSEMIVWGGRTPSGFTGTGGRYDPATDSWSDISTAGAPRARADHTAVWTGTEMIVWGGRDLGVLSSGARYQPAADRWRDVSPEDAPTARYDHTAIWTGAEMIVWGGTPGFLVNTAGSGGRYAP